jgi:hypothetical protein
MKSQPLAIDLFCGLGGWTEGLLAEGYFVVGFDIERHEYDGEKYPGHLVIQDVLTIHGKQFKDADLIVASPPCQAYSYMAMPWSLAKAKAAAIRADETGQKLADLNALFNACFRIQREASEAAGRHIPMVAENVRGAIPWVGRAAWNYGSYYLWGDVPALMPIVHRAVKVPGFRFDGSGKSFQTASVEGMGTKNSGGSWFNIGSPGQKVTGRNPVHELTAEGVKVPSGSGRRTDPGKGARFTSRDCGAEADTYTEDTGLKLGGSWFHGYRPGAQGPRNHGSKSTKRKAASAKIAKIPLTLSQYIARHYLPRVEQAA